MRDLFFSLYRASFLLLLCLSSCLAFPAIVKLFEDVLRAGIKPLRKGIIHIRQVQAKRPARSLDSAHGGAIDHKGSGLRSRLLAERRAHTLFYVPRNGLKSRHRRINLRILIRLFVRGRLGANIKSNSGKIVVLDPLA